MTIKIFDPNNDSSIEVCNAGDDYKDELYFKIDHSEHEVDYLYFSLSKKEAVELIKYLKKEFKLSLGEL